MSSRLPFCLLLLGLSFIETPRSVALGQEPAEAFVGADRSAKHRILREMTSLELQLPPTEVVAIMKAALSDSDRDIRKSGLLAILAHASGPAWTRGGPEAVQLRSREQWTREHPLLMKDLRPHVVAALEDPDPSVRRDAVIALGSMDFDLKRDHLTLREQTIAELGDLYMREAEAFVRVEIIKALALCPVDSQYVRKLLIDALDDPDSGVRKYAVMGGQRLNLPAALPQAIQGLADPDSRTRLFAVGMIGGYGALAVKYIPVLEQALAAETDPDVRSALEQNLAKLRQSR